MKRAYQKLTSTHREQIMKLRQLRREIKTMKDQLPEHDSDEGIDSEKLGDAVTKLDDEMNRGANNDEVISSDQEQS